MLALGVLYTWLGVLYTWWAVASEKAATIRVVIMLAEGIHKATKGAWLYQPFECLVSCKVNMACAKKAA